MQISGADYGPVVPSGVSLCPVCATYDPIAGWSTEGFDWTTATPAARVTILTLEVNERDLVVYVDAPNAGADVGIEEALDIVATLEVH